MNKYKQFSKQYIPEEKEVAITYGVRYQINPYYKPHRHNQERPFLVLCKDEKKGKIISLKIGSAGEKTYSTDFMLKSSEYDYPLAMPKNSKVCLAEIFELENGDFIRGGFKITENDFHNLLSKMMFLYGHGEIELPTKHGKIIRNLLYGSRQLKKSDVIKVPYIRNYVLIIGQEDKNYIGVELLKEETEHCTNVRIFKNDSYIDLDKDLVYIPRNEILYIYENIKNRGYIRGVVVKELKKYYDKKNKSSKKHILSKNT